MLITREKIVKLVVSKLVDNKVDTAKYLFFTKVKYKLRDNLIN